MGVNSGASTSPASLDDGDGARMLLAHGSVDHARELLRIAVVVA